MGPTSHGRVQDDQQPMLYWCMQAAVRSSGFAEMLALISVDGTYFVPFLSLFLLNCLARLLGARKSLAPLFQPHIRSILGDAVLGSSRLLVPNGLAFVHKITRALRQASYVPDKKRVKRFMDIRCFEVDIDTYTASTTSWLDPG
jgi:hypothetical protein